jgi:hypothetical protein
MSIESALQEMQQKSDAFPLSPNDAGHTLKSILPVKEFVEFIAGAPPETIELIGRCIQAIKQGFIDDCSLDETVTSTPTIETMRDWPQLMEFINRWIASF